MEKRKLIYVGVIVLLLLLLFCGKKYYDGKLNKADEKCKTEVLRGGKLKQIAEGHYRKLVADTLTKRELNKIIDSLNIELGNVKPVMYVNIGFKPTDSETPIDWVGITNETVSIEDFYPQKENYFIKYSNSVNTLTSQGIGKFEFNPINISIVLSEREDGIFQTDIKVPDFIKVGKVDVQAIKKTLTPEEKDNFGWIAGGGYGKSLTPDLDDYIRITAGMRIKKLYLELGGNSNNTADAGIKFEF